MHKIIKYLNNSFFPASYKIWKEKQDKTYYFLHKDLRISWISAQLTIHSSMNLPILFILITLIFSFILGLYKIVFETNIYYRISCLVIILYPIAYLLLLNKHYDKYCDEKYKELSQKEMKKK